MNPPKHWKELQPLEFPPSSGNKAARTWTHKLVPGLNVLRSVSIMENGDEWIHVSVARHDRLPSWIEIAKVKSEFIGDDREAFHMIPKKEDHVNLHRYCIHIWSSEKTKANLPNLQNLVFEKAF